MPPADDLNDQAAELLREADELEKQGGRAPPLKVQLGNFILQKEDDNYIKKILKDWDTRGKGEFLRGEFRMNLRNLGLQATPAECDDVSACIRGAANTSPLYAAAHREGAVALAGLTLSHCGCLPRASVSLRRHAPSPLAARR